MPKESPESTPKPKVYKWIKAGYGDGVGSKRIRVEVTPENEAKLEEQETKKLELENGS